MVLSIPYKILDALTHLIFVASHWLAIATIFLAVCYSMGWIHRFLQFVLENEARKILNGTPVTISKLEVDFIRGRAWITNLILHSPRRQEWKWQSPVLARVGKAYVETNLVKCILFDWFLREEIPLELYTIHLTDIQAFVERKQQVFNFFLMDPHVQVPDPIDIDPSTSTTPMDQWDIDRSLPESEQDKAQKIIEDMIRTLGRAAQQGSLQNALTESRESIKFHLKALQTKTRKSEAMQEGVKIVQQVSKTLVEKTQNTHQVVVPARRELKGEKIVYGRVGRVVLQDARIFTRDHQWGDDGNDEVDPSETMRTWNKPIYLERVHVRAAELCPPLSARDENSLPLVYQPLDKCLEVVWKRVLTEMAKSNTGRLFQTAMGEVLDYWMDTSEPATSY